MLLRTLVSLVALCPSLAMADAFRAPALKAATPVSIQAYGHQNPQCTEWTNGCVVCVAAGDQAHCSTPGIACTPGGLTCKRQAKP
jgi:hypothetical protein